MKQTDEKGNPLTHWGGLEDPIVEQVKIKFTERSDIDKFKWNAKKYNYDSQCYIYQMLFGKPLVFYVVDKTTGVLGIFRPTEEFIQSGEAKVSRAIEIFNKYFGDNPVDDIENYYIDEYLY